MVYGDNPQKINEREDVLGLKRYSYAPQISAVIQSGNLYAYCGGNPVFYIDYSGYFADILSSLSSFFDTILYYCEVFCERFTQAVQNAGSLFATAGAVSQLDTLALGPCDVVAAVIAAGTLGYCVGESIGSVVEERAIFAESAREREEEENRYNTLIYRYGGKNPANLTPKLKDLTTGLSFSTVPSSNCVVTTIEEINATGIVHAVRDGLTHVSVVPVGGTVEDWYKAGTNSIWTNAVKAVVKKIGK